MKYKMIIFNEAGRVDTFIAENAKERDMLISLGWVVEN